MSAADGVITEFLAQLRDGTADRRAVDALTQRVYDALHALAERQLRRERAAHTLTPTALVNEAYLKLVEQRTDWQNRAHFLAIAAQVMRRILCNYAIGRRAAKRGSGQEPAEYDDAVIAGVGRSEELLALDEALQRLAQLSERQARVVEMRFFGGLKHEEIAEVLGVSPATARLDWRLARAWLSGELGGTERNRDAGPDAE